MFDKIKDLYNLKSQTQKLQQQLAEEQVIGKSRDGRFSVTMNGNQELLEVYVPTAELVKIEVEQGIKEAFDDARNKIESLLRSKITWPQEL